VSSHLAAIRRAAPRPAPYLGRRPGRPGRLEEEIFGKHVLITDHDDWPVAEVVAGYRSQSEAEFSFRQMKDPHVVSFSPMYHWTEHNIKGPRVHLRARPADRPPDAADRPPGRAWTSRSGKLLGQLAGIGETILLYHGGKGRPRAHRMLDDNHPAPASAQPGLQPRPPRPGPLTWVIHQTSPRTTADQRKQAEDQLIPETRARLRARRASSAHCGRPSRASSPPPLPSRPGRKVEWERSGYSLSSVSAARLLLDLVGGPRSTLRVRCGPCRWRGTAAARGSSCAG